MLSSLAYRTVLANLASLGKPWLGSRAPWNLPSPTRCYLPKCGSWPRNLRNANQEQVNTDAPAAPFGIAGSCSVTRQGRARPATPSFTRLTCITAHKLEAGGQVHRRLVDLVAPLVLLLRAGDIRPEHNTSTPASPTPKAPTRREF
jgi:hypothetical protein